MRTAALLATAITLAACAPYPVVDDPSRYQQSRITHLVLHFTSEHFERSLELLTGRGDTRVSVHWLVPEPGDETYPYDDLRVYRLVPEERRAWHAGRSYWAGAAALNASSIGIEIVNRSACTEDPDAGLPTPETQVCTWLPFADAQVDLVIRLAADILERNPDIEPFDVVGHGDIAPTRRVDPGPLFPWKRLYDAGIGAWFDDDTAALWRQRFEAEPPSLAHLQRAFRAWGYDLDDTGDNDVATRFVVRAFQMHFRPAVHDGIADPETAAILFALLEKYRPAQLRRITETDPESITGEIPVADGG